MAGVGCGTAPGLLAAGLFGMGLSRRFTRLGMRAAGVFVLAIGLIVFGHAARAVLSSDSAANAPCCCREHSK